MIHDRGNIVELKLFVSNFTFQTCLITSMPYVPTHWNLLHKSAFSIFDTLVRLIFWQIRFLFEIKDYFCSQYIHDISIINFYH